MKSPLPPRGKPPLRLRQQDSPTQTEDPDADHSQEDGQDQQQRAASGVPVRHRRRSMFGSTSSGEKREMDECPSKPPLSSSRRRSIFGSTPPPSPGRDTISRPRLCNVSRQNSAETLDTASSVPSSPVPSTPTSKRGRLPKLPVGLVRRLRSNSSDVKESNSQCSGTTRSSSLGRGSNHSLASRGSISRASNHSASSSGTTGATIKPRISNVYELVNYERTKRGLQPFSRNMLLDSVARDIAEDLAKSRGADISQEMEYHGNIGKGKSIDEIHATMMRDRNGTSRLSILSKDFREFGISTCKGFGPDCGSVYMCQLFKG
jgi:hypothetical protein